MPELRKRDTGSRNLEEADRLGAIRRTTLFVAIVCYLCRVISM